MKPILFSTEMVRAILDGRKTVTRRLVKQSQVIGFLPDRCKNGTPDEFIKEKPLLFLPYCNMDDNTLIESIYKSPCQVGDILYVRETWMKADDGLHYKADIKVPSESEELRKAYGYKWHPSIHMPKEAARIFLKVTNVRVERLQDITEEQAKKEGFSSRDDFINAILKMYPEATINSYVWVIEFERCEKPEVAHEN